MIASWHDSIGDVSNRLWDLIGAGMLGWVEGANIQQQLEQIRFRSHSGLCVGYIDMSEFGPLWGALQSAAVTSAPSLLAAGRELREQFNKYRGGLLVIDSASGAFGNLECNHSHAVACLSDWEEWATEAGYTILVIDRSAATWHHCASAVLNLDPAPTAHDRQACRLVAEKLPWGPNPKPLILTRKWCDGHNNENVCFATMTFERYRLPLTPCPNGAWGICESTYND